MDSSQQSNKVAPAATTQFPPVIHRGRQIYQGAVTNAHVFAQEAAEWLRTSNARNNGFYEMEYRRSVDRTMLQNYVKLFQSMYGDTSAKEAVDVVVHFSDNVRVIIKSDKNKTVMRKTQILRRPMHKFSAEHGPDVTRNGAKSTFVRISGVLSLEESNVDNASDYVEAANMLLETLDSTSFSLKRTVLETLVPEQVHTFQVSENPTLKSLTLQQLHDILPALSWVRAGNNFMACATHVQGMHIAFGDIQVHVEHVATKEEVTDEVQQTLKKLQQKKLPIPSLVRHRHRHTFTHSRTFFIDCTHMRTTFPVKEGDPDQNCFNVEIEYNGRFCEPHEVHQLFEFDDVFQLPPVLLSALLTRVV
ncbi:hypothetical protein OAM67_00305 [bacterium]|nr:hypothetical protein [bacterium]